MRKKIFGLSTIVLMLLGLAACKAALAVPTLGNKPRKLAPGEVFVTVELNDDTFPTYRAIVPERWDSTHKEELRFSLHEGSITGTVVAGFENKTWSDIKNGYVINIPAGNHSFFLVGKKDGKMALKSEEVIITTPGAQVLKFKLLPCRDDKTESDAAAKGSVDITFVFLNPAKPSSGGTYPDYKPVDKVNIDFKVYDAMGQATNAPGQTINEKIPPEVHSDAGTPAQVSKIRFAKSNVKPGIYLFEAQLMKGTEKFGPPASSLVIVDPANITKAYINIDYELGTVPLAPSDLAVIYNRPLNDEDATTAYTATFVWQDNSLNETGFILEITENGSTTPIIKAIDSNLETVDVTLTLEKKYTATIRATNGFGDSKKVPFKDPATGDLIHLARIRYDLDGGTVIPNPDPAATTQIKPLASTGNKAVGYYTQVKDGFMLPGSGKLPYLYKKLIDTNNGTEKIFELKGWTGAQVDLPPPATEGTKLKADCYANLADLKAIWQPLEPMISQLPTYPDSCRIEGQNMIIKTKPTEDKTLTANVYTEGYEIDTVTWLVNGTAVTGGASSGTQATLTQKFSAGTYRVIVIIKLKPTPGSTNTGVRFVESSCLVASK